MKSNCHLLSFLLVAIAALSTLVSAQAAKGKYLMYVGTYSQRGSRGIYEYLFDSGSGEVSPVGVAGETKDPSFLVIHPNHRWLYAVNEQQKYKGQSSGGVTAFSIEPGTGKLTEINQLASRGADPCYIAIDRTGKFALVANYTGGNLAVFPIESDGKLGESSALVQHHGSGPNHDRQEAAHAHYVDLSPDNRFALAVDLGLDEIASYHFDAHSGQLATDPQIANVDPGAGPRHLAFSPNGEFIYVIDEIKATITSFSYDSKNGTLHRLEVVPTLPDDFKAENTSAEIVMHPTGKFMYISNRGHDSIAAFAIDARTGKLTLIERTPTQGKAPRNFEIDPTGTRLFVANQESDNIVVFKIDPASGRLTPTGQQFKVPAPVCIRFMAE